MRIINESQELRKKIGIFQPIRSVKTRNKILKDIRPSLEASFRSNEAFEWGSNRNLSLDRRYSSALRKLNTLLHSLDELNSGNLRLKQLADPLLTLGLLTSFEELEKIYSSAESKELSKKDTNPILSIESFLRVMFKNKIFQNRLMEIQKSKMKQSSNTLSMETKLNLKRRKILLNQLLKSVPDQAKVHVFQRSGLKQRNIYLKDNDRFTALKHIMN